MTMTADLNVEDDDGDGGDDGDDDNICCDDISCVMFAVCASWRNSRPESVCKMLCSCSRSCSMDSKDVCVE